MKKILLLHTFLVLLMFGLRAQFAANVLNNPSCNGVCNGAVQITPLGNYHYQWTTGDTIATLQGLCPGGYWCRVSDSSYHLLDSVFVLLQQPIPMTAATTANNATCGLSNGTVVVTTSGGNPPYTYAWSNGMFGVGVANNLAAGTYAITITDASGCSASAFAVVANSSASLSIQDSLTVPSACGACSGLVYTTILGGISPYTYLWNGTDTRMNAPLCPGLNSLQVTDANGCLGTAQFVVNSASGMTASAVNTDINCPNLLDTTILTISGGSHLVNILWGDNTAIDSGVASPYAHTYTTYGVFGIEVIDTAGCAYFVIDTVKNNGLQPFVSQSHNTYCNSLNTGSVQVGTLTGTPPFTYLWNNGAAADSITNVAAGNYAVTVTDHTGCSASLTYTLLQINSEQGYYVYEQTKQVNCNAPNGAAIAQVYGGVSPYSYLWTGGATTDTLSNLTMGNYNVTVTDAQGCQALGYGYVSSSCTNLIEGIVFVDENGNCLLDSGDVSFQSSVTATNNRGTYYGYADNSGAYAIEVPDTGTYYLNVMLPFCGSAAPCGNTSHTVNFSSMGDTSRNNNFAFVSVQSFDLTLHPGWTSVNPGLTKEYWVMGYNQSPLPFTGSATIVFSYDSNLIYQSSYAPIPTHNAVAHTLTWVVNSLPSPYFDWNSRFRNFFTVPATLDPGYLLQSKFTISPTVGDCDSLNNVFIYSEPCTGSHDPNEKVVSPAGALSEKDSVLTYTIHFQNTGTAPTKFIIVTDTLSPNLDPATVVNLASSAQYAKFDISGTGILTWIFNPLFLPDSLTDVNGSKGFVMFSVKRKSNLPTGATISNRASIYFDYNTPVATNTVRDTVANPNYIFEVHGNSNVEVKAFPNPFSDIANIIVSGITAEFGFELYDVTGRLQQSLPSVGNSQFQIHRNQLQGGVYLYRIVVSGNQVAYGKLVVE